MGKPIAVEELTPEIDINGNSIDIGTRVRTHDFAMGYKGGEPPIGLDVEGDNAHYLEGVVTDKRVVMEGCKRYTIDVDKECRSGIVVERSDTVYPPLNGTPSIMGGVTAGVVRAG